MTRIHCYWYTMYS